MKTTVPKFKIDNSKLTRLVIKAQNGSEKALEEIANLVSGYIYYYSITLLCNEDKAQDCVQDVLLIMLKKLNTLNNPKLFLGWIKVITANYCRTKISRTYSFDSLDECREDYLDDNDQINPEKSAEKEEIRSLVRNAVRALPVLQRESVLMYYFEQLSVSEIAESLEVKEATVKSRLFAARTSLKKYFEKYGNIAAFSVSPMSYISYSLINDAEKPVKKVIPYTTPKGKVMVATLKPYAAVSTMSVKVAALGCACLVTMSGVSVIAVSGKEDHSSAPLTEETTAPYPGFNRNYSDEVDFNSLKEYRSGYDNEDAYNKEENSIKPLKNTESYEPTENITDNKNSSEVETVNVKEYKNVSKTDPVKENNFIYIDTTAWDGVTKVYCHIFEKNGKAFFEWRTNFELCDKVGNVYVYDLSKLIASDTISGGIKEGVQYGVIFTSDKGSTKELSFSSKTIGDTVIVSDNKDSGVSDSVNKSFNSYWKSERSNETNTPSISGASLKAGESMSLKLTNGTAKAWKSSDKKIVFVKNGRVTALTKGTAKVTATLSDGKKITAVIKVTSNPQLSKTKLTVKRNKIKAVKILGKAKAFNNKYKNTKTAKVVSSKSASKIKVKGIKKRSTTLKIKVNGKSLMLKVKVI